MVLRSDRTLFWPRRQWLIVADLHLGKAESLRRDGVALPGAVMDADLQRLAVALARTEARRLLILGDLVHDAHGMTAAMVRRVSEWRRRIPVEMMLVPGNHDRHVDELPPSWEIERLAERVNDPPFTFTHAPDDTGAPVAFNWHGHVHPVRTVRGGGDRLRLPCFCVGASSGVLPAFSSLAGGAEQPCAPGVQQWVVMDQHIVRVPMR
jgi:DNA ligase-associated metallophosphoesterase